MAVEEKEVCEIHTTHRSVYPLIFRIIFMGLIFIFIKIIIAITWNLITRSFPTIPSIYFFGMIDFILNLLFAIALIYTCLLWLSEIYIFTKQKILVQTGLISTRQEDYGHVFGPEIKIDQTLIAKFFDYGNIRMYGIRGDEILVITDIPNPEHFKKIIIDYFLKKPSGGEE